MAPELGDPTVRHLPERHRFEILDGETVIGTAHYVPFDATSGGQRIFFHTVIDDAYSGRGLGGVLVTAALEDTVAAGLAIVPVCPYVRAFLRRHPDLAAHAVDAGAEHHAALAHR